MTERFLEYDLDGLIERGARLIVDQELRVISLLQDGTIREQQLLPDKEFGVLLVLLLHYPDYAPLEDLQRALTGRSIERCRAMINRAFDEGQGDAVLRPIRNVISRVRPKLHPFGMDARSIIETGYLLMQDRANRYSRRNGNSQHS